MRKGSYCFLSGVDAINDVEVTSASVKVACAKATDATVAMFAPERVVQLG
jgi:hypothetical protein